MPNIWSTVDGISWHRKPFQDIESARDYALDACAEQCNVGEVDILCLLEVNGKVYEFFITFVDDSDDEPWYSHRICEELSLEAAKKAGFMIETSDVEANYTPNRDGDDV